MDCECEHVCHMDTSKRSPLGNPGHKYGAKFHSLYCEQIKTPYGTFRVCRDCAKDCYAMYPVVK